MRYIDLTLSTPEQNLACDEALLDFCEEGCDQEILRFWEPDRHFVVLGYSNKIDSEVSLATCRSCNVPVLRRCSGGGTVLQGPGCLDFSLILRTSNSGPLRSVTDTNSFIMHRHQQALQPIVASPIKLQGFTDLTLDGWKFSGNAQRRKRRFLLFHGTFLIQFDIPLVEKFLPIPARQPPYRHNRPHTAFLVNLNVPLPVVKETIRKSWKALSRLDKVPLEKIDCLAKQKYSSAQWTFRC